MVGGAGADLEGDGVGEIEQLRIEMKGWNLAFCVLGRHRDSVRRNDRPKSSALSFSSCPYSQRSLPMSDL